MKTQPTLTRWSYSLWAALKACPYAVKLSKIDKIQTPMVPAMERGNTIHLKAEHFLKGNIRGMPKELVKLKDEYDTLKKMKPEHIEEFWAVDRKRFARVKDGWKDGWFTLKADVALKPRKGVAISVDHKTGKIYETHDAQAELSAMMHHIWYPDADLYVAEFFYVDQGITIPYEFKPSYLDKAIPIWRARGEEVMAERKFLPTPSADACKWCSFRSDKVLPDGKKGPCRAWKAVKDMQ